MNDTEAQTSGEGTAAQPAPEDASRHEAGGSIDVTGSIARRSFPTTRLTISRSSWASLRARSICCCT